MPTDTTVLESRAREATAMDSEYLSISQTAATFGISQKTVRRWIASGRLPAERIGARLIRIRQSDLAHVSRSVPSAVD